MFVVIFCLYLRDDEVHAVAKYDFFFVFEEGTVFLAIEAEEFIPPRQNNLKNDNTLICLSFHCKSMPLRQIFILRCAYKSN